MPGARVGLFCARRPPVNDGAPTEILHQLRDLLACRFVVVSLFQQAATPSPLGPSLAARA